MLSACMKYDLAQVERAHNEKLAEFNAADRHPLYSHPCANCGCYFVGHDWLRAESVYCSKKCQLAHERPNNPLRRHEINLFWRDFGRYIKLLDEEP